MARGVLLLLLLCAAPAHAELRVLFGPIYPKVKLDSENVEDFAKPGKALGLRYLFETDSIFSFGFEAAALRPEDAVVRDFRLGELTSGFESYLLLLELRLARREGFFRPYVLGGAGGHQTKLRLDLSPPPLSVWVDSGTQEKRSILDAEGVVGGAATLQAGLDLYFNESICLGAAGVWYYLGDTKHEPTAFFRDVAEFPAVKASLTATAVMVTLGLRFY